MTDASSARDSRLLLIRLRPAISSTPTTSPKIALEAEAIVDYESIYPSTRFTIDLNELQSSIASPNNLYGQLLGAQLCAAPSMQAALAGLGQSASLRIQLMLEGTGPQESIRWERMTVPARPGEPVAIRRDTPFSRFAAVDLPQDAAPEDARFHLLVAIAGPAPDEVARFEVAEIDAVAECSAIVDACQDLLRNGQMQLTLM